MCDASSICVKGKISGRTLLHASSIGNVYPLAIPMSSHSAFATLLDPITSWHYHLVHCGARILSLLQNRNLVSFSNKFHDYCSSRRLANSHRLLFKLVENCCQKPLELIHSVLWQSLVLSNLGYQHYICFVDDFTRYTWVYVLA